MLIVTASDCRRREECDIIMTSSERIHEGIGNSSSWFDVLEIPTVLGCMNESGDDEIVAARRRSPTNGPSPRKDFTIVGFL
jgi:hypothetical protein